jgi:putative ABC transport system permease protein
MQSPASPDGWSVRASLKGGFLRGATAELRDSGSAVSAWTVGGRERELRTVAWLGRFALRAWVYYAPVHLALAAVIACAMAVVTGCLWVATSIEQSLVHAAFHRLGPVHTVIRFAFPLPEPAAKRLIEAAEKAGYRAARLLTLPGAVSRRAAATGHPGPTVPSRLYGVDEKALAFLLPEPGAAGELAWIRRARSAQEAAVNETLAQALRIPEAQVPLNVRVVRWDDVPREFVLGHRSDVVYTHRVVTSRRFLSGHPLALFDLELGLQKPRSLWVPLETLQAWTAMGSRINTILLAPMGPKITPLEECLSQWKRSLRFQDLALQWSRTQAGYWRLHSPRILLHPHVVEVATEVAQRRGLVVDRVAVQVAIRMSPADRPDSWRCPYSVLVAVDPQAQSHFGPWTVVEGQLRGSWKADEIVLNTWAAEDLHVNVGDRVRVTYFRTDSSGQLQEEWALFRVRAIVAPQSAAADPALVPEYPGLTDAEAMARWEAPFPVQFERIRPKDESYWKQYRTAPKAFLSVEAAAKLWATPWGLYTSLRFASPSPSNPSQADWAHSLEEQILAELDLGALGVRIDSVRQLAREAAQGSTDFQLLFLGFGSLLLIATFLLLVLVLRLFVIHRLRHVGLWRALGFSQPHVGGLLGAELVGAWVLGVAAGGFGAAGFASFVLGVFQRMWPSEDPLSGLELTFSWGPVLAGVTATALATAAGVGQMLWRLVRWPIRNLLACRPSAAELWVGDRPSYGLLAVMIAVVAGTSLAWGFWSQEKAGPFFATGASLLVLQIWGIRAGLRGWGPLRRRHSLSWLGLAARHLKHNTTRALLVIAMMACSSFVLTVTAVHYPQAQPLDRNRDSGHGGFVLWAETTLPLYRRLSTEEERLEAGVHDPADPRWSELTLYYLRRRQADEASCRNLYRALDPTIIGVPRDFRLRGGFRFARVAPTSGGTENPWKLLEHLSEAREIPAFCDAQTLRWMFRKHLGDTVEVVADDGRPVRLKIVATLQRSLFQSEVVISEENFLRYFATHSGYRVLLAETDPGRGAELGGFLESQLGDYGSRVLLTTQRLAEYFAVEETYLQTFQMFGAFGFLLGTLGLGGVLWRSVWERMGELAMLRALGFSGWHLVGLILAEDGWLMGFGLAAGTSAALVAAAPHLWSAGQAVPWPSWLGLLVAVMLTGLLAGLVPAWLASRADLVLRLRGE